MPKEKVLSISIAAYNVSEYLKKTLESIIGSEGSLDSLEIIIVNDGSTDKTGSIARRYQDLYPDSVIVIDKENAGYGSTINAALKVAKGKYFKLLDGDDFYYSSELSEYVSYLDKTDADLVVSPYYLVSSEIVLKDFHNEIPQSKSKYQELIIQNPLFSMYEVAIATDVLRKLNSPITENCFYTDTEFLFYCILSSQTISRFQAPVYCYRFGNEGQSVSLTGIRKHYRDMITVSKRIYDAYEMHLKQGLCNNKKIILDECLLKHTFNTYNSYMLLENVYSGKKELINFDFEMKEKYPMAYAIGYRSKLVSLLRNMHFLGYGFISRMAFEKYKKRNR